MMETLWLIYWTRSLVDAVMHARDLCLARDDALACFAVLSYRKISSVLSIKESKGIRIYTAKQMKNRRMQ